MQRHCLCICKQPFLTFNINIIMTKKRSKKTGLKANGKLKKGFRYNKRGQVVHAKKRKK